MTRREPPRAPPARAARPSPRRPPRGRPAARELDHILITGAREHNLKGVELRIPKRRLVVLTGVSGSGKSSLAFDTLFAEGQRRYVESLSAYARQFLGRLDKPRYDTIRGLSPAVSIEQKTTSSNPRSTVGTITELADYLRLLFARVGEQHCPGCGSPVAPQTPERITKLLLASPKGTRLLLLAPLLVNRKGEHRELLERARRAGWVRLRVDGTLVESAGLEALDKRAKHHIEAVIDRVVVGSGLAARLTGSVEQALRAGQGTLIVVGPDGERVFSEHAACARCGLSFPELTPQGFSFNAPQGMCPACNGLGTRLSVDRKRVVPDESKSIDEGAIVPWGAGVSKQVGWGHGFRAQLLRALGIPLDEPWSRLSAAHQRALWLGTGERVYRIEWKSHAGQGSYEMRWEGLLAEVMDRFSSTESELARRRYAELMSQAPCDRCGGARLRAESAAVRVGGKSIVEIGRLTVTDASRFFSELRLAGAAGEIAEEVLKEIRSRLGFLESVGLGYLSLERAGSTLSGGEAQRIRLASQVGSELTGVIYILDEPSIGLHQRDNRRLLDTLERLRDLGNTVVVVEHDEDTIRAADHVIDFGPGAGALGGQVVYSGTPAGLERCRASLTGAYLAGRARIELPRARRTPSGWLELRGARANNLNALDVRVPLGVLTCVTGVSGAGKSTLVSELLYPALAARLGGDGREPEGLDALLGAEQLDKVVAIDQRPIGRTPRSNPATYIKVFDEIRGFFAELPEARVQGYSPARFSFNLKGGRCEACEGDGVRRVEMHFLADVYVRCEDCGGRRFNEATLEVRYKEHSIADVLELTVREAIELFAAHPKIRAPLELLAEVGVDYLHLGQPSPTLSGGEAQRIKLGRELARRATGRTLYVLDEPTTGLHFDDVKKLLQVLERLVDAGNSVVVIEHDLDVIKRADWLIDLGPEGGPGGGELLAAGTPETVARAPASHTGRYLAGVLAAHGARPRAAGRAAPTRSRRRS
ncbi:MAG: excinuclease ABC subunit UvrA [Sorangiineae bacterium]|nr:excinuclease ABC subunit UvrA [Polyangiaceae bacterium]MEB2322797.1 excinuclease ABC subunit UvrA [Sorangiineae bacterium]